MYMRVWLCVSHDYYIIAIMMAECDGAAIGISVLICVTHNCEVSCVVITVTSTSNGHHVCSLIHCITFSNNQWLKLD